MDDWMVFLKDLAIECVLSPEQKRAFLARFDRTNTGKKNKWIVDQTKDDDNRQVFAGEPAFTKLMTAVYRAFQQTLFPDLSKVRKGKKEKLEAFLKSEFERRQKAEIPITESTNEPRSGLNPGAPMPKVRLPEIFVERPGALAEVKRKLLVESDQTLVVNAIAGLGGLGKSVLAMALVLDPEVQARFEDGILWKTLGQSPDLLSCLGDWIRELDKSRETYRANTVEAASQYLGMLLAEQRMLLVVDDVWNGAHAEWFRVGGPDCRILVTTREKWRLDGVVYHELGLMSEEESLELVRRKLDNKWKPEMKAEVAAFARLVGYLPLALDLAANLVPEGLSWEELRSEFEVERRAVALGILDSSESFEQLSEEEREKEERKHSLQACFNLSLKRLKPEQLQQFIWLGVLPEDVNLTAQVAAVLWDLTEIKAKKVLIDLRNRSFLTDGVMTVEEERTYRVHDLMHDMARGLIEQGKLKLTSLNSAFSILNSSHGKFLERYRKCCSNGRWDGLPNDGYIHRYLTWHMEQAEQTDEIHALMAMSDERGRNAWFEACDQLGQPAIFVTDLSHAWRLAQDMYREDAPRSIGLQVRYAVIFSSLNSLASNIPPALIATLIEKKQWSAAQGLAYAWQAQRPKQRSEIIQALSAYLPHVLLSEALEVVRRIHEQPSQASALIRLAPYLPDQLLSKALEIARGMREQSSQIDVLIGLAPHLPEQLLSEALEIVQEIWSEPSRSAMLSELASQANPSRIITLYRIRKAESSQASALSGLAPYLPKRLLPRALEVAQEMQTESSRTSALRGLVPYLPEQLLSEALEMARGMQDTSSRSNALSALVPHLPEIESEVLEVLQGMQDESSRAATFKRLVPSLSEQLLPEALEVARGMQDESFRVVALSALAQYQPEIVPEVLETVQRMKGGHERDSALVDLVSYLPEQLSSEVLEEILKMVRGLQDVSLQVVALGKLALCLPEIASEALEVVRGMQDESSRTSVLIGLVPYLPEQLFSEVLEVVREIQDELLRALVFQMRVLYLPEHLLSEALDLVQEMQDENQQWFALRSLIPHLSEHLSPKLLEIVREIHDEYLQADVLRELAPRLPEQLLLEALEIVGGMHGPSQQANALRGLAPHLPEQQLPKALEMVQRIQDEYDRAVALGRLAQYLPEIVSEALEAAREIQYGFVRVFVLLRGFASYMPEIVSEALEVAKGIRDESSRATALSRLAPYLPEHLVSKVLEIVQDIQSEHDRASVLRELAPYLPELLLSKALEIVWEIQSEYDRVSALRELAPYLPEPLLSKRIFGKWETTLNVEERCSGV